MKYFICCFLTIFIFSVCIVNALECWTCFAVLGTRHDCENNVTIDSVDTDNCDYITYNRSLECFVYILEKAVMRGCGYDNTCERLNKMPEARSCRQCTSNLCNDWVLDEN